jgi:hypothetical protein
LARSANLVRWVEHFLKCFACGRDRDAPAFEGDMLLSSRESAPTSELCVKGRKLRDAWLDEPEERRASW